jgi:ABC-type multidrug transport system ATPase subunit
MKILPFSKTYEDRKVLDFPGMELQPGKIYAVIGANGSGKSTFAKILAGILTADKKGKHLEGGCIGYMPQKTYPFRLSVSANLRLGGRNDAREKELKEALGLSHLARRKMSRLSGGECARLALARLLMRSWDLLVLDEPTAAMDMESTLQAEKLIRQCTSEGTSVLLITHNIRQAERIADEVLFFSGGRLTEAGTKEQILKNPTQPETIRFLEFCGSV